MKIYIGTDHAGFGIKEVLVAHLKSAGHEVVDKGALALDPEDDYPDYVIPVAEEVSRDPESKGIVLGATGQGEAIAANKVKGVRAAVYYGAPKFVIDGDADMITRTRQHNDANVLSLGARYLDEAEAIEVVTKWLATPYEAEERHARRLAKIAKIDS
ncbi:MAG: RpiB/LacA/LacB family sugar-phosphate isomerase [bacterium]